MSDVQEWQAIMDDITGSNDPVTTQRMDELVRDYAEQRATCDIITKRLKEATEVRVKMEQEIIAHCEVTGKKNWEVQGFGEAIVINKKTYKMPKDILDKGEVFDWLNTELGQDGLMAYLTINAQTFNKLVREKKEDDPEFEVKGVEEPYEYKQLQWRKN